MKNIYVVTPYLELCLSILFAQIMHRNRQGFFHLKNADIRKGAFFIRKMLLIYFLFLHKNIWWYSLEVPWLGASNEYPQHIFSWRNKTNIMWIPPLICSYGYVCQKMDKYSTLNMIPQSMKFRNFQTTFKILS